MAPPGNDTRTRVKSGFEKSAQCSVAATSRTAMSFCSPGCSAMGRGIAAVARTNNQTPPAAHSTTPSTPSMTPVRWSERRHKVMTTAAVSTNATYMSGDARQERPRRQSAWHPIG